MTEITIDVPPEVESLANRVSPNAVSTEDWLALQIEQAVYGARMEGEQQSLQQQVTQTQQAIAQGTAEPDGEDQTPGAADD